MKYYQCIIRMNGKQSEGAEEEIEGLTEVGVSIVFNKQVDSNRERLMGMQ